MRIKKLLPMMLLASAPFTAMAQGQAGIKAENLDKSVRPADNFFTFATGGWQKLNPLPGAFSRFGSFDQLQDRAFLERRGFEPDLRSIGQTRQYQAIPSEAV